MQRSTDRILVTHAGSLPRPDDLRPMVFAKLGGQPFDAATLDARIASAVAELVDLQLASGIDSINDGELSKSNFLTYVRERVGGLDPVPGPTEPSAISARDRQEFAAYFEVTGAGFPTQPLYVREPLKYIGQAAVQADIANLKAALAGKNVLEAFIPAVAPGSIEHWMRNAYYKDDAEFLFALAGVMHEEYKAITDAGFLLQIDDPDLPDGWQMFPEFSVPDYQRYAELRVDALNHALRDIPEESIRFHTCWGSYHGPHKYDIPLRDMVHLMLKVKASSYSIEASNPVHEHEWRVWEDVKLPAGKTLIPGVVGHCTDFIEHPQLVADRLVRYARLVGRENLIAGTDCGLGGRVGHPSICWAKFQAMAEGARLASNQLW